MNEEYNRKRKIMNEWTNFVLSVSPSNKVKKLQSMIE